MSAAPRIAFVAPRFAEGATLGGAETLLRALADHAAEAGAAVTFLTTCARDHFTWANAVPPGERTVGRLTVRFFPVDADRDARHFERLQQRICHGAELTAEEEEDWLRHSVNSPALLAHLQEHGAAYDAIVAGPYLFGLTVAACRLWPSKALLVPCLHDEPFARVGVIRELFRTAAGLAFNTPPERDLALRLYGLDTARTSVVGMGLDDFQADPRRTAARLGLQAPYVVYCGRREPMKGTPLLLDYLDAFRSRTGRDVKLVFTGSGPYQTPAGLEGHVHDLGFVGEQDKRDAMAGALAFCHPSLHESLSIVLLEAWLAGTPALVHAAGEVLQYQCRTSGGGLWFRSYPEFESELLLLLDRCDLRAQLAAAGRAFVLREYRWDAVLQRFFGAIAALSR
jgi:glycosyltransferase involved in cell wall biosynthesis